MDACFSLYLERNMLWKEIIMCTVFAGLEQDFHILAKNYDCFIEGGMLFTNKRGVRKKSLVMPPQKEFYWTSAYGSVTFSQSGKGMPVCGVNEKGLIVEQATMPEAVYPSEEGKAAISCLEAVQYLLDTCETVQQAVAAFENFNISNQSGKLHYFLMDTSGDKAIVEFLGGERFVFQGSGMLPLITNSAYTATCEGKSDFISEYEENSYKRFDVVKEELKRENPLTVDSAFRILYEARRDDTVWSVVYDLASGLICFRDGTGKVKALNLNTVDYREDAPSYLYDMESGEEFAWQPYSREMNRKNIEKFYGNPMVLQVLNLPDAGFVIQSFDEHIQGIEEGI